MRLSWAVIFAFAFLVASLYGLIWGIQLHTGPFTAKAFAVEQAQRRGIDWPLESHNNNGSGRHRFLFRSPAEPDRYADLHVQWVDGQWAVEKFNGDFRPWQIPSATASR